MASAGETSNHYDIRHAGASDWAAFAALVSAQLKEQEGGSPVSPDAIHAVLTESEAREGFPKECLVAIGPGSSVEIVGCAVLAPIFGLPANALGLRHLFVAPDHRRRGVGRGLIAAVAERATALGCARIEWQVPRLDLEPRAFFEIVAPDSFRLNDLTYIIEAAKFDTLSGNS